MNILKKAVVLLAVMSISVFTLGCSSDEADDAGEATDAAVESTEDSGADISEIIEKAIEDAE